MAHRRKRHSEIIIKTTIDGKPQTILIRCRHHVTRTRQLHPEAPRTTSSDTSPCLPTSSTNSIHPLSPSNTSFSFSFWFTRHLTMGDVAVENPANSLTPLPRPGALDTLANLDSLEGTGADGNDEYATLKRLQRHLELVHPMMSSYDETDASQIHSAAGGIHQG